MHALNIDARHNSAHEGQDITLAPLCDQLGMVRLRDHAPSDRVIDFSLHVYAAEGAPPYLLRGEK
jgi:hypothetical protein